MIQKPTLSSLSVEEEGQKPFQPTYSKDYIEEVTKKANFVRAKVLNNEELSIEDAKIMVEYNRVNRTTVFEFKKAAIKEKKPKGDKPIKYDKNDVEQPIVFVELTPKQINSYTNKLGKGTISWVELKQLENAIGEEIYSKEDFLKLRG